MTTEDELIRLKLIEGMPETSHKQKILETLQISNMNLDSRYKLTIEKVQNIKSYILQAIGEAQISKKRIRMAKTKTFVQISKNLGSKIR